MACSECPYNFLCFLLLFDPYHWSMCYHVSESWNFLYSNLPLTFPWLVLTNWNSENLWCAFLIAIDRTGREPSRRAKLWKQVNLPLSTANDCFIKLSIPQIIGIFSALFSVEICQYSLFEYQFLMYSHFRSSSIILYENRSVFLYGYYSSLLFVFVY